MSSVLTVVPKFDFNSLATAEKQQSIDDHAEYQEVLREIARDECERTEAEILRLLERCGRDTSDLKADVDWRIERDEQITEVKREDEYHAKNTELLARLKSLSDEFKKVEAEYHTARNPIIWESNALDKKIRDISGFRSKLLETCRDTNLKIELQVLDASLDHEIEHKLFKRQEKIGSEISQLQYQLANLPISFDRRDRQKDIKLEIQALQDEWQQLELKKGEMAQKKIEHRKMLDAHREKMIFS
jgi:hypothetical protein